MLRLAKVVATHPEDHSVDLLMLHDLSRYAGVQVLVDMAGLDCGTSNLVEPELSNPDDKWAAKDSKKRDITAVVGFIANQPLVLGFLHPQVTQMLFKRKNFHVRRHPSDVYSSMDDDGNLEVSHPSGTFIRMAVNPEHEDLTGKDFDKKWAIKRNKDKKVAVRIEVAAGGARKSTLTMLPDGTVTLDATAQVTLRTPAKLLFDAPVSEFTGQVNVGKGVKATGNVEGADCISGGISGKTHTHTDTAGLGAGTTSPPNT